MADKRATKVILFSFRQTSHAVTLTKTASNPGDKNNLNQTPAQPSVDKTTLKQAAQLSRPGLTQRSIETNVIIPTAPN